MKKSPILLKFPPSYRLDEKWEALQKLNPEVRLEIWKKNALLIFEKTYVFEDFESVELVFDKKNKPTYRQILAIENQSEHYRIEVDTEKIILIMATSSFIGMLTASIIASLYFYFKKKGYIFSESTPYVFTENGEKVRREADASFISFEDYDQETQKKWVGKPIPVPPTLVIEIVSAKNGTKAAIWKMENIWIRFGSKIGLVVCPFSEKIYVFEKNNSYSQSIYLPFTHPKLEGYVGDFSEYIKDIRDNLD